MDEQHYDNLPNIEEFVASAVQYLLEGDDTEVARLLLNCNVDLEWLRPSMVSDTGIKVVLHGPRAIYDRLNDEADSASHILNTAFIAVTDPPFYFERTIVRMEHVKVGPEWRREAIERIEGKAISNQGNPINGSPIYWWKDLRFRSDTERRVARVLEMTNILFFANCMARVTTEEGRKNREPDFLICDKGKWGILEIDGEAWHTSAAMDHQRDRAFRLQGIYVERFTGKECYDDPTNVVKRFLAGLAAPR